MRLIVAGDIHKPILLRTTDATAILIETDDGQPNVIFKLLPDGKGWIRSVKGEDKNFNDIARQYGLV
jgi:hypothetical protein